MPGYRKLGRPSAHRKSMLRNLVTDLFREGRIQTTDCRAKEARREAEKLITLAKRGDPVSYTHLLETVVKLYFKHSVRLCVDNCSHGFNDVFFRHKCISFFITM